MRRFFFILPVFILAGCATARMSGYISRADHPYERKIYGSFEKVVSSIDFVLKSKGWTVIDEVDPAVYERDDRYDNNGYRNLLIMTDIRKKAMHLTGMHLNLFVHSMNETCDVEVRYESRTSLIKQFTSDNNDQMVQGILDDIQDEAGR